MSSSCDSDIQQVTLINGTAVCRREGGRTNKYETISNCYHSKQLIFVKIPYLDEIHFVPDQSMLLRCNHWLL